MDKRRVTVCIDDPESGAVLYRLDDHQRVKTFPVPLTGGEKLPRQVRFVDDSRAIVIGSDHSVVYIFDRRDAKIIDKLMIKGKGWVQCIAVRSRLGVRLLCSGLQWDQTADCNSIPTIFAAKSGEGLAENDIFMWRKTADTGHSNTNMCNSIIALLQGSILLASLVYAYKNREALEEIMKNMANFN